MRRSKTVVLGCGIGAVILAGCSGAAEPGEPPAASTEDAEATDGAPDAAPSEAADGDAAVEADADSELSAGPSGGGDDTPQDLDLDLSERHVGGTVLEVSGLRFEGNTILLDAEFINGSTREVTLSIAGHSGQRLRLIDDVGNTYNFVVPDGEEDQLTLPVGESIGGAFAFLGPLDRHASELTLAVNHYDPVDDFDPATDTHAGTGTPPFVVSGIELVR